MLLVVDELYLHEKVIVDETFIRKPKNFIKSIVGIDAIHLYSYSMC